MLKRVGDNGSLAFNASSGPEYSVLDSRLEHCDSSTFTYRFIPSIYRSLCTRLRNQHRPELNPILRNVAQRLVDALLRKRAAVDPSLNTLRNREVEHLPDLPRRTNVRAGNRCVLRCDGLRVEPGQVLLRKGDKAKDAEGCK